MVKRFYKINEKSKVLGLLVFILFFGLSMPLINKSHEYEKSAIINDELDHKDLRPSLYEQWNDTYSFAGTEKGLNVEMDDEGNVYVAGPVDHPSELYNFGVNKYNSAGELLWNRSYDGFGSTDWCDDLAVDTVNNVFYLVGYSYTGSSWNMTLVQYTTDGVYQWNRTWASSSGQGSFGKRVAVNSSGYVFISGETGDYEFTIACFNFYGQRIRNRTVFFNTEFQLTDMVIDEESNLYLTGYNYTNYYPLINKYNTFIGKYNKNLNEEWVRFYTDDYYNITKSQGIALDSTNYVYVCDLLGENYSTSGQYWHLIKYDTNGNYILNKTLFSSLTNEENHPADIAVDSKNDFIYLVGRINGTNYSEDVDVIVVKCDGEGNYLFNWTWDGGDWDYGNGLYYNPEAELIVCGERDSDLRQETSNQDFDMLVIKYPLKPENFTLNLNRYEPGTYDENGIIELNWNESLPYDINNYTVYNSTDPITEINESLNIHKEDYIDTNLLVEGLTDGTYYYLVQAFNEYGNSTSNYVEVKVKLLPKNFTLTSNATSPETDGIFTLFWEESIAANNYTIYNSTSHIDEINSSVSIVDFGITDLNYTVNNDYDGSMYYAVGAKNDVGDTLSNNILVDIQIIPGPLTLTSNATNPDQDGNFTLSWTESEKADNYTLYTHNNYITHINESLTTILDQTNDLELFFSINTSGSYYYIVQAFNENGNSSSNCLKVTLELPPEAPILTSNATDPDQDGNFTLFWSNTFRADNYTIYNYTTPITSINDSLGIVAKEISELNYTITNWIEGNHYFVVVANNSFGMTMSNCINIWVLFPPESFVLDTNATSPDIDGFFGLNWSESIGANTYSVYQSQNYINEIGTGVEIIFSSLTNRETNLFNISGDYYFVVIAFNEAGNSTSNNIFVSIQIPPGTFSLTSHDATEPELDGVYSLNWTESQYADNYSLYWSYSEITDIGAPDVQLLYNGTNLSYTFEELLGNEDDIYYFKVVSTNEFSSEESNSYNITVGYPGVIPEQFVLSSDDATEPELDGLYNLNWTQSQYADNYSLYWSYHEITEINGSVQLLYNGTNLSYSFEELLGNEDDVYYFKVYAYNQFGSNESNSFNVTLGYPGVIPEPFVLSSDDAEEPELDGIYSLNWSQSQYADNYSLYYSLSKIVNVNDPEVNLLYNGTSLSYTFTSRLDKDDVIYYFKVVSHNQFGSNESNSFNITYGYPGVLPESFVLTSNNAGDPDADGEFTLSWTVSQYADTYELYWSLSEISDINDSRVTLLYNGTLREYEIVESHGFMDDEYYFKVISYNQFGSNESNSFSVGIGNVNPTTDEGLPWWLQAIFTGMISASAGLMIKIAYSRYKKRQELLKKISKKMEKIDNIEQFMKQNLGFEEWKKLQEPLSEYRKRNIDEKDLVKKAKKEIGDRFMQLFDNN